MKTILFATIALFTLAATSAMAAPARHHHARTAAPAVTTNSVISEGVVIGKDPDAHVRFELLRDAGSHNQG